MKWTPEEDATLRSLYSSSTRREIAAVLGRTEGMVRSRCWTLGLASKKVVPWSDEEISKLRLAYEAPANDVFDLDSLAAMLGRLKSNVSRKARELGLTDSARKRKLNPKGAPLPKFATVEERSAAMSARAKRRIAENGHPRGALGMRHTEETKRAMSAAAKAMWADPSSKLNSPEAAQRRSDILVRRIEAGQMRSGYTRTRGGRREDLGGRYFRSAWEANYARWLTYLQGRGEIASWDYECKTFVFEAIKRGTRAYTPDFKVVENSGAHVWHEVKGWMDEKSQTRLKRMAKYFPGEKVIVVDAAWFRQANRTIAGLIPAWEKGTTR